MGALCRLFSCRDLSVIAMERICSVRLFFSYGHKGSIIFFWPLSILLLLMTRKCDFLSLFYKQKLKLLNLVAWSASQWKRRKV
jgi:predicted lipid carrier protein YhbT